LTQFSNFFALKYPTKYIKGKRKSNINKLETTYRFGLDMINSSSNFILKNPNQIQKELKTSELVMHNICDDDLADIIEIGTIEVLRGTIKFAEWSSKMAEIGNQIKPYLKAIYNQIRNETPIKGMDSEGYVDAYINDNIGKNSAISFYYYNSTSYTSKAVINPLIKILDKIYSISKLNGNLDLTDHPTIKLVGRYSFSADNIKESEDFDFKYDRIKGINKVTYKKFPKFDIEFITAHASKGLESDFIILIDVNSGKHGFPSEVTDDPLIDSLLQDSDNFPNAEERRLFYVAITRSRKHTFIISNQNYPSNFIAEFNTESTKLNKPCRCGAEVMLREGEFGEFYGCKNWPHFCRITMNKVDYEIENEDYKPDSENDNKPIPPIIGDDLPF